MPDGERFQIADQGRSLDVRRVVLPVGDHGVGEVRALRRQMVRLAEQVRHRKAEIEGRIAQMDHLVVEQNQAVLMNENIFGAVVAMYQRDPALARCCRSAR